ncbi:hypothetical protein ACT17Q_12705 [Cellulomonas sp. CW35]|uniref:hypothetical protein n=1 Tax=Cellulomonas sp. CW35 TaxID=3458249 RepID=UPI00403412B7
MSADDVVIDLAGYRPDLDALVRAWPGAKHSSDPTRWAEFPCPVCGVGEVLHRFGTDTAICQSGRGCSLEAIEDALRAGVVAPSGSTDVPSLPTDIERCPIHGHNLSHACATCLVVRAQVDRYAKARAVAREVQAMASPDAWLAVDLSDAPAHPPRSLLWAEPIEPGGERVALLRPGQVSGVHGVSGSAKTHFAYLGAVQEVEAENLVVIIDYEMRRVQARKALVELGLSDAQIKDGIVYVEDPPLVDDAGFARLMEQVLDRSERTKRPLTFGIFDSVSRSMGKVPGWSSNDEMNVNAWYDSLPRRILREFPEYTPFTIDHPGRTDGPNSIGSHAKGAGPDFRVWCQQRTKFSRANGGVGRSTLQVVKDRAGEMRLDVDIAEIVVVGGHLRLRMLPEQGGEGEVEVPLDAAPSWALTEADQALLDRLRAAGADGLMTKEVCGEGGDYKPRRKALERLQSRGLVTWLPAGRANRGQRWWASEFAPTT